MATLRFYWRAIVESASAVFRFGTGEVPHREVTVDGSPTGEPQRVTIAAGTTAAIWTYKTTEREWSLFHGRIVGTGYAVLSALVAKPTSASDLNPLQPAVGPDWRWRHQDISDHAPVILSSDQCYMSDDDDLDNDSGNLIHADYAGGGYQSDLDGSSPKLWDGVGPPPVANTQGRIYKIVVRNVSATDSITFEWGMVK